MIGHSPSHGLRRASPLKEGAKATILLRRYTIIYLSSVEPGGPNGVTTTTGLTDSSCQPVLPVRRADHSDRSGVPNGVTMITGLTGSNWERRLAAK